MKRNAWITRFTRDETGSTLLEMALVLPIFLALIFAFIDYSRVAFSYVMAGKATERAVRLAVVRPPLCDGVPNVHMRGSNTNEDISFGASCSFDANLCAPVQEVQCTLPANQGPGLAIWNEVRPLMPTNASSDNLLIRYQQSEQLGFLGGPYTPVVTVEIQNLNFEFVTPLGALLSLAGATNTQSAGVDHAFPSMSASLPGEALSDGDPS